MDQISLAAISRMSALRAQMDIIANNIANVATPGYRSQHVVFVEYYDKKNPTVKDYALVSHQGQYQSETPGNMSRTGNPLDLALEGPGYFGVKTSQGIRYTRAGNFSINGINQLVTPSGQPVVNEGGGIITIPETAKEIRVNKDGSIATNEGEVTRLMIAEFDNVQTLNPVGNNLYESEVPPKQSRKTIVFQGSLEKSNVRPVLEMSRMIEVSRTYQSSQRLTQTEHERIRDMIQSLTQT